MESSKLSGEGKRRRIINKTQHKFTWNFERRQVLHVLHKGFTFSSSEKERIFSHIFRDHVRACGLLGDVPWNRLNVQWMDKRPKDWITIVAPATSPEEQAKRDSIKVQITEATRSLGIGMTKISMTRLQGQQSSNPRSPPTPPLMNAPHALTTVRRLPLSEQPAVGLWDPDIEDHSPDEDEAPRSKRLKVTRTLAYVEVPRNPRSPRKVSRESPKKSKSPANIPFPRPGDNERGARTLHLTQEQYQLASQELTPVQEQEAHPGVQPLLFRYFHEDKGKEYHNLANPTKSFLARKYTKNVFLKCSPRRYDEVDFTDLLNHLDRVETPTPFISTSNALWWILRLALKDRNEAGVKTGRISVIDGTRLDPRSVYHVPPYHRKLRQTYGFYNGAWHYAGTSEFIVHQEIPAHAIMHTFTIEELYIFVDRNPLIGRTLELDLLGTRGALKKTILPMLRAKNVLMNHELATTIAEIIKFIGLEEASVDQISHLTMDILQGWGIFLARETDEKWREIARSFARAFTSRGDFGDTMEKMCGFLDGVRYASSKAFNTRLSPVDMERMQKQAHTIGLGNVARVLSGEIDRVRLMLFSQENKKNRLMRPANGRAALQDVEDQDNEPDENEVARGSVVRRSRRQAMIVESDGVEAASDDDESEVFEFGEDGLVAI